MDPATATLIDGQQAFGMIGTVMWTMLRTGAMLMAMPLVGTRAVPVRVRVLLAGALAMAIAPLLPPPPASAGIDAATVLGVAREVALGVAMGFVLRLVFEAGAVAGELVSQGMGLAFAQMNDPLRGTSSGVVAQWFYLAFGLLFFAADGHLAMVALLVRSYQALPVGMPWSDAAGSLGRLARTGLGGKARRRRRRYPGNGRRGAARSTRCDVRPGTATPRAAPAPAGPSGAFHLPRAAA